MSACPDWCQTSHAGTTYEDHHRRFGHACSVLSQDGERLVEVETLIVDVEAAEDLAALLEKLAVKSPAEIREIAGDVRKAAARLA